MFVGQFVSGYSIVSRDPEEFDVVFVGEFENHFLDFCDRRCRLAVGVESCEN